MKKQKTSEEVEALKNQLARALADYDNLQKRVERQTVELYTSVSGRIIKRLLPILDMLEAAGKHIADPGLAITIKEFKDLLANEGFEEIKLEVGSKFDENLQEAIEVLETDKEDEDNTIAEIALTGWKQADNQVVRPAKVKVKKYKNI